MTKPSKLSAGQVVQALIDRPWSASVHMALWSIVIIAFCLGVVVAL